MEDQIISFETACLAKKKGFKEDCFNFYSFCEKLFSSEVSHIKLHPDKEIYLPKLKGYNPKGTIFEERGHIFYGEPYILTSDIFINYDTFENILSNCYSLSKDRICLAPTQSLLQKWIREKHNIHIALMFITNVKNYPDHWNFYIDIVDGRIIIKNPLVLGGFPTYEEALEKGLEESLKLI